MSHRQCHRSRFSDFFRYPGIASNTAGSSSRGRGIAIPHCKTSAVDKPFVAFAKPVEPIPYGATDGAPVHSLFVVVSPLEAADEHVSILRWIAGIARSDYYAKLLSTTRDPQSLFELFHEIDEALNPKPSPVRA